MFGAGEGSDEISSHKKVVLAPSSTRVYVVREEMHYRFLLYIAHVDIVV